MANDGYASGIRVLKKKRVAETLKTVVSNKADVSELGASLHRLYSQHERQMNAERETIHELIAASVLLATAIGQVQQVVLHQDAKIAELRAEVERLRHPDA